MTLRAKSAQSGVIVTAMTSTLQLLRIVSTILLARILEPEHFGIMAMANLVTAALAMFAGVGLSQALIATRKDPENSAWQVFCAVSATGLILSIGLYLSSGSVAAFFDESSLKSVCEALATVVFLQALIIVPDSMLVKKMSFGRRVVPTVLSSLSGIAVSLYMAYAGFGLWSLVIGAVTSSAMLLFGILWVSNLSWIRNGKWKWEDFKSLLRIGLSNLSTWLTQYLYNNADHLVVAKSLGATQLGFYSQAFSLSRLPVQTISAAINSVLLPAYSTISDDPDRLRSSYLDSLRVMAVITTPIAFGLFVIAPEAIIVLIGEKWKSAVPMIQVFAIMSLVRPISGTTSPLFLSLEKPQYNLYCALVQALVLLMLIWPLLYFGAVGVACAVVAAFVAGYIQNLYVMSKRLPVRFKVSKVLRQLIPSTIASLVMAASVVAIKAVVNSRFGGIDDIATLFAVIMLGALVYVAALFAASRELALDVYALFRGAIFSR